VIFLDTSVLIATAQVSHEHHAPSRGLWNQCARDVSAVSTHTIAELYDTLTSMPRALRLTPRDTVLAVETFLKRLTPITLSADEYIATLERTAKLGHTGGMIYDALHMASARKIGAEQIYTWNIRHFQTVAPDLADRVVTP
jgi:predicted nucleic acid-binding protein